MRDASTTVSPDLPIEDFNGRNWKDPGDTDPGSWRPLAKRGDPPHWMRVRISSGSERRVPLVARRPTTDEPQRASTDLW